MTSITKVLSGLILMLSAATMAMGAENSVGDPIEHWLDSEFVNSTLTREQQTAELLWFHDASKPYQGLSIRVVSERIDTHWYEANVLAKAFEDITGIQVIHEITGEDDVIKKISTQMTFDYNLYDAYISDSDLIGTYYRSDKIMAS